MTVLEQAKTICDDLRKLDPEREEFTGYDEAAIEILPELVAAYEALQSSIDKPIEEGHWQLDLDLANSNAFIATGLLKTWLLAFRKAQNSNLVRAQQNESLVAECKNLRVLLDRAHDRHMASDAECERLRQDNKYLRDRRTCQAAKIIGMQTELARWQKIARDGAATILQLQAAQELGITSSDHIVEANELIRQCDISDQLPDATKLILTKEQRAALEYAIDRLSICASEQEDPMAADTLRAMLSQSSPGWQITEERQDALIHAIAVQKKYVCGAVYEDFNMRCLRTMLGECQK